MSDVIAVSAETREGLADALAPYLANGYEKVGLPSLGGFSQLVRKVPPPEFPRSLRCNGLTGHVIGRAP